MEIKAELVFMFEGRVSAPLGQQRTLNLSSHQSGLPGLSCGLLAEMLGSSAVTLQGAVCLCPWELQEDLLLLRS